jgi:hypothetical protein
MSPQICSLSYQELNDVLLDAIMTSGPLLVSFKSIKILAHQTQNIEVPEKHPK